MKNDKINTYVELRINPEFIAEVLPEATKTRDFILLEEGCEAFILTRKKEEPNTLIIFAIYTSRATYKWHMEQDYSQSFFSFLNDKLLAPPAITYLEDI